MKKESDSHADCYQRLVKDMPIGFAHCKMIFKSGKPIDFIYLDVNRAYGKLTGLGNVIGKKVTELLPGVWQSNKELFAIYGRVALSGRPEHFERYIERLKLWLNMVVHSPEKEHFVIMVENITERKAAEEALHKSNDRFQKIVEQAPIAMAVVGMDETIEFINRKAVTVFGYLPKDIPTMDRWWVQAYPDKVYRKEVVADWTGRIKKALTEGGEIVGNEYRVTCKDGAVKTMFISGVPVADKIFVMFDDITERKQAEDGLKESKERFSHLAQASFEGIAIHDKGLILDANQAMADLFGYKLSELIGINVLTLAAPQSRDLVRNNFLSGYEKPYEATGLRTDGATFNGELSSRSINYQGRTVRVTAVRDITERKRMEEALRESEIIHRALVESSPDAITQTDLSGRILMCNRQAALLHGYERPEDLIGKSAFDLFPPDEHERAGLNLQKTLAGKAVNNIEYRFVKKDGSQFDGELSATALTDAEGKPSSFMAITRDISERKRAEIALRESEERFSTAFKTSPYAYIIATMEDGRIIEVNDAFTALSGFSREESLASSTLSLKLWVDEKDRQRMLTALREGRPVNGLETTLQGKKGDFKTVMLSAQVIRLGHRACILSIVQDITERKRMEQELRNSESNYRTLMEQASDAIFISDQDGNYTDANVRATSMLGYSREEILHLGMKDLLLPEEITSSPIKFKELLSGETVISERRMRRKDGSVVYTEISGKMLGDDRFQGIVRDITERKQAEAAIAAEKERLAVTLRSIGDAVIATDVRGTIVLMNKVAETLSGWPLSEAEGRPLAEVFHIINQLTRKPCANPVEKVLASGSVVSLENHTLLVARDGKEFAIADSGAPIKDRENKTIGVVLVFRDNTEKQRSQEAMRHAQQQITEALSFNKMILESSPVGMLVYKASGECVSVNQAGARIIGGTTEQLLAQNFRGLASWKRDGLLESADRALTSGKPVTGEIRSISSFGKTAWFNTSFAPFSAGGENHLLFLIEDISERRKADEVRKALEDQLNQKQKLDSLGVLAGGIAHDFNNLLTGIFGYIDLARSSSKDAKTAEYLAATLAAMNRARSLTLQLLTFAKGGFPLQKITPLTPFIEDTARFALSGSTISCKFSLPENLWPCNIDKDQIGQVIDNIVINAQQAMPNGGDIEITARNISFGEKEHPPLAKGDYVKVSIKDHGIGIPKDIIPRIFDPFYTTKTKGHGLGLATCYSIITRHEGCIEVESEQGKGSTFHVYLPASPESVVKETVATGRHKGSGTILVMDDEEVVRDTLRQMLESMGYTVVCRNDGEAAVDFYGGEMRAKRQCSGMIFDLTVAGGMGGIETVKKIRNLNKEIPIFVASGYTDDAVMKNPADYGFTASISKPFTLAELSEMLNKNMKH